MSWYYARDNQRFGPVEQSEIQRLASTGVLGTDDLVWQPGLPQWRPAREIPEIATFFRPTHPGSYTPYPPPQSQPTPLPQGSGGFVPPAINPVAPQFASFGIRFAALLIDQILFLCIEFAIFLLIFLGMASAGEEPTGGVEFVLYIIGILLGWLYYAGLESSSKMATLGKSMLGLKVTDLQGQRIDFGRATGRYFGKFLSAIALCLGFILMISDPRRQTWHDKMAGCLVLKVR